MALGLPAGLETEARSFPPFRLPERPTRPPFRAGTRPRLRRLRLLLECERNRDDDARATPFGWVEAGALDAPHEAADHLVPEPATSRRGGGNDFPVGADLRRDFHRSLQIRVRCQAAVVASAESSLHAGDDALGVRHLATAHFRRTDIGVALGSFDSAALASATRRAGGRLTDGPE